MSEFGRYQTRGLVGNFLINRLLHGFLLSVIFLILVFYFVAFDDGSLIVAIYLAVIILDLTVTFTSLLYVLSMRSYR